MLESHRFLQRLVDHMMSGRARALVSSRLGSKSQEQSKRESGKCTSGGGILATQDRSETEASLRNAPRTWWNSSLRGAKCRRTFCLQQCPVFVIKARGYSKTFSHDKLLKACTPLLRLKGSASSGQDPSTKEFYDVFRFLIAQLDPVCMQW